MLDWLYDIFVTIVSFILGLFGFDLKKRSVTFADEVEKKEESNTTPLETTESTPVESVPIESVPIESSPTESTQ